MAKVTLRYVHEFVDRHGTVRRYFRRYGKSTALPGKPGSTAFLSAYRDALKASERARPAAARRVDPFSLAAVINSYVGSREFSDLRPITQATYRNILRRMEADHGDKDAISMSRSDVLRILDSLSPGAVKNWLGVIRILCRHMLDLGWRETDPTLRIRKPKRGRGFPTWTAEDAEAYMKRHPKGSKARLAFMLLAFTGQRRADIVTLGRQHIRNGRIVVDTGQSKTGNRISVPILPILADEIARHPAGMTFLVTEYGAPFSAAGFGNWFRARCDEAGVSKSAHGLRKFLGSTLAELGAPDKERMAVLGHETASEAVMYAKAADLDRLSDAAMKRFEGTEMIRKFANL